MPHSEASDPDLHCLLMSHKKDARLLWVKVLILLFLVFRYMIHVWDYIWLWFSYLMICIYSSLEIALLKEIACYLDYFWHLYPICDPFSLYSGPLSSAHLSVYILWMPLLQTLWTHIRLLHKLEAVCSWFIVSTASMIKIRIRCILIYAAHREADDIFQDEKVLAG